MSEKRRDSKGRVLRIGEVQRADGKYMYRYTNMYGERKTIYSWKLVETDRAPEGVRCGAALRTMISDIENDLRDGIKTSVSRDSTLNDLFDAFMELRTDLKEATRCNYLHLFNVNVREKIGKCRIDKLNHTTVLSFYLSLSQEKGLKISTIRAIHSIIWQSLQNAVNDALIRRNPANDAMKSVSKKLKEEPKHRPSLTIEQQKRFIDYVNNSNRYKCYSSLLTVLLGTGLRIGECLGLRWCDVDFKNNIIHIDHTLSYKERESGGYSYRINKPKTLSGIRDVPMLSDVKKALQKEKRRKKNPDWEQFTVDGYSGFIFLNANGKVYSGSAVYDKIQAIVYDYNKEETAKAARENREACLIPKISPHILRHTFCTRLCEGTEDIKVVQNVLGHKNVRTTLNVYDEASSERKADRFKSIEGSIYLG